MSSSNMHRFWDVVVVLFTTAAALTIPLAMIPGWDALPFVRPVLVVVTVIFTADAVVRWRRGAGDKTGGGFAVRVAADIVPAFPLFLLTGMPLTMLARLGKLYRVSEFARDLIRRKVHRASYLRLAFFVYGLFLSAHWITCGWIALRTSPIEAATSWSNYVHALYWCVSTLTTVGYGDVVPVNNAQTLYAIAVMILGVGVYAYIIGNIASILANIDPARTRYIQQMDRLGAFVRYRDVPPDLQRRIRDYYDYVWDKRLGYDESQILSSLPSALREEIALFLKRDFLERVPLFADASDEFARQVALHMTSEIYTPGDYVVRVGETGRDMYFICRGSVEVVQPDGTVATTLSSGDFFGEIALLEDRPRNASIRAVDYCDLYRLSRDVFVRIAAHHPEISEEIARKAHERTRAVGDNAATHRGTD